MNRMGRGITIPGSTKPQSRRAISARETALSLRPNWLSTRITWNTRLSVMLSEGWGAEMRSKDCGQKDIHPSHLIFIGDAVVVCLGKGKPVN
jgi:hypothetical protein